MKAGGALKGKELEALQKAATQQADDAARLAQIRVILGEESAAKATESLKGFDDISAMIQKDSEARIKKQAKILPKAVAVTAAVIVAIILLVITVNIFIRNHIVQKLIDAGANVNALDNLGNNPLHFLAAGPKFKLKERKLGVIAAHMLLDAGGNPKATNNAGLTPYQIARKNYRLILAAVLKPKAVARRQIRRAWLKGKVETVKGKFAQ